MLIGVYGISGSGKSTLTKELCKRFNFLHVDLDQIAKDCYELNDELREDVEHYFTTCRKADGEIDNHLLQEVIFGDYESSKFAWQILNDLYRPYIIKRINKLYNICDNLVFDCWKPFDISTLKPQLPLLKYDLLINVNQPISKCFSQANWRVSSIFDKQSEDYNKKRIIKMRQDTQTKILQAYKYCYTNTLRFNNDYVELLEDNKDQREMIFNKIEGFMNEYQIQ